MTAPGPFAHSLQDQIRHAERLVRAGRADEARALFERLADAVPAQDAAPLRLALLHESAGRAEEALRWFRETVRRNPLNAVARYGIGVLLAARREPQAAAQWFRTVLALHPDHADSFGNLGVLLRRAGQSQEAATPLKRAVRLKRDDVAKHDALAHALYARHDLAGAAGALRAMLCLDPAHGEALFNLPTILPHLCRDAEAVHWFSRALRVTPQSPENRVRLGNLLLGRDGAPAAEAQFRRAATLEPNTPTAYHALGRAAWAAKDAAAEERHLSRVLRLEEKDIPVRRRIAALAAADGRASEAAGHLLRVLELLPEDEQALGAVAPLLTQLGRTEELARLARRAAGSYQAWIARYDTLDEADRAAIRRRIVSFVDPPRISVVLPVYNPPPALLDAAIRSVRGQLYPHWELCIADDASTNPAIRPLLERHAAEDPRVRVVFRTVNGHISRSSNSALELATGELLVLLDHDDLLSERALYMVAETFLTHPETQLAYSDTDKIDEAGVRFAPYFKGGWDPDLLRGQNYLCHLVAYRRARVMEAGGFRPGFEGSQDWDLVLRVSERLPADAIRHIPHVLYHWRSIPGSTSVAIENKPYAAVAGTSAVREHVTRLGLGASVEPTPSGPRTIFPVPDPAPMVSVIVPTRDHLDLLEPCVEGVLRRTDYAPLELIVVDNGSRDPDTLAYLEELERSGRGRVLRMPGAFNYSALNNAAVRVARGELLCFLNNDVEPMEPGWLREMAAQALRPEIGAVGAKLYYQDGTVQHAGIVTGNELIAFQHHVGELRASNGYYGRARLVHAESAVTGACLVLRRAVFEAVGGFDAENLRVNYNDVDLCLRIGVMGLRSVVTPFAELYHYESRSRGSFLTDERRAELEKEGEAMRRRWGERLARDPHYSPNLSALTPFTLADEPRVSKPWSALIRR